VAQAGVAQAKVGVEPQVLPAGAGTKVGREPTAATDAGEAGKWGHDGTLSGASGEHYRTKLPQPSSFLPPCGRGLHCP
jgi:hypothetical protein